MSDAAMTAKRRPATPRNTDRHRAHRPPAAKLNSLLRGNHALTSFIISKCLQAATVKPKLSTSVTYRLALLVLASVQHSPVDLSGVPLGQEGRLTLGVQKLEHLLNTIH